MSCLCQLRVNKSTQLAKLTLKCLGKIKGFEAGGIILDSLSVWGDSFLLSIRTIGLRKYQNSLASPLSGEWHWPPWSISWAGCCCIKGRWADGDDYSTVPAWRSVRAHTHGSGMFLCKCVPAFLITCIKQSLQQGFLKLTWAEKSMFHIQTTPWSFVTLHIARKTSDS